MTVSIFTNKESKQGKEVELSYVLEKIKAGAFKKEIEAIRELDKTDSDAANVLKGKLPGVTFCGIFSQRVASKMIRSTGLAILDFDDKDQDPEILKKSKFVYCLFKSPRGGYKVLVRIPQVKDDNGFKGYFYALQAIFPDIDTSGKDISRFCFISYDPDLYINDNSEVFTDVLTPNQKAPQQTTRVNKTDFKKLAHVVNMIDGCDVGARNVTILKAGRLAGGFISAGIVNELDVLDVCERAVYDKDPADARVNFNTFRRGIEHGKLEPLNDNEIKETINEVKIGKIDYTIEEANEGLETMYEKGFVQGYLSGWPHFDKYYSVIPGYTTYIYGSPFAGKSKWWFNMLVHLSIRYKLKHVIYSPETGSKEDVYAILIQIYGKADITNTFQNQMPRTTFDEAKNFIGKHFIVVSTDETDTELSPSDFLDYVDVIESKYNTKIHTVTIDPWNELKHNDESARDLYLNTELKKVRVNARKKERHICIITHIRDQKAIAQDELGTSIYAFPTPQDVAGGQVWYRKGFMMLSFYRHFIPDGNDSVKIGKDRIFNKNQLNIRVQKFKPEGSGKRGEIEFTYHPKLHIFSSPNNEFSQPINYYEKETDETDEVPF